jgi:pimeloyl-ACP methyl ester carboxylesterase
MAAYAQEPYMKKIMIILTMALTVSALHSSEIVKIKLFDGETMTGKLDLPLGGGDVHELVMFIAGTGPNTYINHRKLGDAEFNYFDLFVDEFAKRGVAFFAYNRRGVEIGDTPPYYDTVDKEKYKKYLPGIEVKDIETAIGHLRNDPRLKTAKVILLGWSEGTILAAMAAENTDNKIAALFLAGYAHENMSDIIKWQLSGEPSIINIRKYFDTDKDNAIVRSEYEATTAAANYMRTNVFQNAKFEDLDVNKDEKIDSADFKIINSGRLQAVLNAIEKNDDAWIWTNYFRITTAWLKEYFALEPNKTRLLRIDIPIYIFHGEDDASVSVAGVLDIKDRFAKKNKTNLQCFVFKAHDHDLNYMLWPLKKTISEGIQKIFDVAGFRAL